MIDIENEVMTLVYDAVHPTYESANFESGLNLSPSKFPCVCVEEVNNTTRRSTIDSSGREKYANIAYEINVFTNNVSGKKAAAKAIMQLIDEAFTRKGFERVTKQPYSLDNGTKYRLLARYQATVAEDYTIYGR